MVNDIDKVDLLMKKLINTMKKDNTLQLLHGKSIYVCALCAAVLCCVGQGAWMFGSRAIKPTMLYSANVALFYALKIALRGRTVREACL